MKSRADTPALEDSIDILKAIRSKKLESYKKDNDFSNMDNDEKIKYIKSVIQISTEDPSAAEKRKLEGKNGNRRSLQSEDGDTDTVIQSISSAMYFENSPPYIKCGKMKPFQIDALNWLIRRHHLGVNSILADEMGLGKTLETISLLGYLYHVQDVHGPHLVVSPKSTIDNWRKEVQKWLPSISVGLMGGTKESRDECKKECFTGNKLTVDVLVCSYQVVLKEKNLLRKQKFVYLILDEAHSAKNEQTQFYDGLSEIRAAHKLFLTGTPLQNTLHELWALLQFLLPGIFRISQLDGIFDSIESEKFERYIGSIRDFIKPFMLRRLKSDVQKELPPKKEIKLFVPLTEFQRIWYKKVLMGDITTIIGERVIKTKLNNTMMQLRKVCDHPYLMPGAEPEPYENGDHICNSSAKMIVMMKLLDKHIKNKGKVLVFSQMTRMLDIIDDYLYFKEIEHYRIDGQTQQDLRVEQIDDFNNPDGKVNVFLLSTRSGGLGINLQSADTVILYDSDWNPQSDIQAMDRAHRIGQTKPVTVYRLIAEKTAEERLIRVAERKLMLNQLVMQSGKTARETTMGKEEFQQIMQQELNSCLKDDQVVQKVENMGIDDIIKLGEEKTNVLKEEIAKETETARKGMVNLTNFAFGNDQINIREFEGKVFGAGEEMADMERYKANMKIMRSETLRPPRSVRFRDFQFADDELKGILQKEEEKYQKLSQTFKEDLMLGILKGEDIAKIVRPMYLTPEEEKRKDELVKSSFLSWDENDFKKWKMGMKKYGREKVDELSVYMNKPVNEVQRYNDLFEKRYKEVEDGEKLYISLYKSENKRKAKEAEMIELNKAIQAKPDVLSVLTPYVVIGKSMTDPLVDSMLLRRYAEIGEDWDKILEDVKNCPLFVFDIYLHGYTTKTVKEKIRNLIRNAEKSREKIEKNEKERCGEIKIDSMEEFMGGGKKERKDK
ncbi:helicase, putative [Entamoeba invadens IP1]|uniref:Helicase, putative n=1 Tax=Entamoeba invadens IP1 TaxID=370355 RepID=A0A0A1U4T8_ENTIV|nr:helicase, putative [Entamoeba invadens IP1]ELP89209.1 helicase, putative [Entamoeba invadens IP1]|eukprot:XP_004255980.1 helicase, putative [Entamoeba invadens IP1]